MPQEGAEGTKTHETDQDLPVRIMALISFSRSFMEGIVEGTALSEEICLWCGNEESAGWCGALS